MKPGLPGGAYPRVNEPITFGVPLGKGVASAQQAWRLTGPAGDCHDVQTRALETWPDGSVRWLLVDGLIDVPSGEPADFFLESTGATTLSAPISISETHDSIEINTGAAVFKMKTGGAFPLASVRLPSGEVPIESSAVAVTDEAGILHRTTVRSVRIEERGPLRSAVRVEGEVSIAGAGRPLHVSAAMQFYAGLPVASVSFTLANPNAARHQGGFWDLGDPGSVLLKDVSITFNTASPRLSGVVSPELGKDPEPFAGSLELYQDSSGGAAWQSTNHLNRHHRVPTAFRGYRLRMDGGERSGNRATPLLQTSSAGLSVPEFWQNFPMACEVKDGALTLRVLPGQFSDLHELQGGEQKTYEFFVSAGDKTSLDWTRARTVACVDPAFVMKSGAVPFLAELSEAHASLANSAVDGTDSFDAKREVIDEYGWRHFGEIYGDHEAINQTTPPLVSHYNNQYDPLAGFIYQFLRTADVRWWRMARELAAHVRDIDVYHTTHDRVAYNGGLFWHTYHYGDADTATHRTYPLAGKGRNHGGGPSADHNYTTGLMHQYFLSGDPTFRDTAIDLARYVIRIDDGRGTVFRWLSSADTGGAIRSAPGYYGPGRGPANSLNALLDGHRLTKAPELLQKAEQLIRRVVHPVDDISRNRLEAPEERWFYVMFLEALGKYLHYKRELGQMDEAFDYARLSLLHYATWMAGYEYPWMDKPEKLEIPTETWTAQELRKSDVFYLAARFADAGSRSQFIERAQFFYWNTLNSLAGAATRKLARPVVVVLVCGRLHGPDAGAALPGVPELKAWQGAGFQAFVPQRERALRRARQMAAGLAIAGAAAMYWLFSL